MPAALTLGVDLHTVKRMFPVVVNVLSAIGIALGVCAAGYTLYEHIRDARQRERANPAAKS